MKTETRSTHKEDIDMTATEWLRKWRMEMGAKWVRERIGYEGVQSGDAMIAEMYTTSSPSYETWSSA
jgi:hypothetical protein